MKKYISHRLAVVVSFFLLIGLSYSVTFLFFTNLNPWYLVLSFVILFGYTHFILGAGYQIQSYRRKQNSLAWLAWFSIFVVISALVATGLLFSQTLLIASFPIVWYFVWHSYENEITLYERQTNRPANKITIGAIVLVLLGISTLGIGHESWFFTATLQFIGVSQTFVQNYLNSSQVAEFSRIFGLAVLSLGLLLQALSIIHANGIKNRIAHGLILLSLVGLGVFSLLLYPIHYVFMVSLLLFYHFGIWFIFFAEKFFYEDRVRFNNYIIFHVLLFLIFMLLLLNTWWGSSMRSWLLNFYTFFALTVIHISLSFLNESWMQKALGINKAQVTIRRDK